MDSAQQIAEESTNNDNVNSTQPLPQSSSPPLPSSSTSSSSSAAAAAATTAPETTRSTQEASSIAADATTTSTTSSTSQDFDDATKSSNDSSNTFRMTTTSTSEAEAAASSASPTSSSSPSIPSFSSTPGAVAESAVAASTSNDDVEKSPAKSVQPAANTNDSDTAARPHQQNENEQNQQQSSSEHVLADSQGTERTCETEANKLLSNSSNVGGEGGGDSALAVDTSAPQISSTKEPETNKVDTTQPTVNTSNESCTSNTNSSENLQRRTSSSEVVVSQEEKEAERPVMAAETSSSTTTNERTEPAVLPDESVSIAPKIHSNTDTSRTDSESVQMVNSVDSSVSRETTTSATVGTSQGSSSTGSDNHRQSVNENRVEAIAADSTPTVCRESKGESCLKNLNVDSKESEKESASTDQMPRSCEYNSATASTSRQIESERDQKVETTPKPNGNEISKELCNYSSTPVVQVGNKSKESPSEQRKDIRMLDCPSSSSSSSTTGTSSSSTSVHSSKESIRQLENMSAKYNDVVVSSTNLNSIGRGPQPITTPVIASTKTGPYGASSHANETSSNRSEARTSGNEQQQVPSRRSSSSSVDRAEPGSSGSVNSTQTRGNESKSGRSSSELVSSSINTPLSEDRREVVRFSETVDQKTQSNVITYQTSNQAIVASTIRHLFQRSASEENRPRPPLGAPPKLYPNEASSGPPASDLSKMTNHQSMSRPANPYHQHHYPSGGSSLPQNSRENQPQTSHSRSRDVTPDSQRNETVPRPGEYYHPSKVAANHWNSSYSQPSAVHSNSISSSSNSYKYPPTSSRAEVPVSTTEATQSVDSFPRIPAMVDTVLAMKKSSRPEPERRYNNMPTQHQPLPQQQQHHHPRDQSPHQHHSREQSPHQHHPRDRSPLHHSRDQSPHSSLAPPEFYQLPTQHPNYRVLNHEPQPPPPPQRNPIYVDNPDFSKIAQNLPATHPHPHHLQPQHPQQMNSAGSKHSASLSQLHMKTPDFSQVKESKAKATTAAPPVTQENFDEIRKKYNYVNDLRLKNAPAGGHEEPSQERGPYNTLYMKAPEFSTQKFQSKVAESATSAYSSSRSAPDSRYAKAEQHNVLTKQFPQLSDDVVMSVVSSKPASTAQSTTSSYDKKKSDFYDHQPYSGKVEGPMPYSNTIHHPQMRENVSPYSYPSSSLSTDAKGPHHRDQVAQISSASVHSREYYTSTGYPMDQRQMHQHPAQSMAAATSVIQSARPKERAVEYPQPKPQERPVTSPNYYHHQYSPHHQQHSPHLTANGPYGHKNTSPSPLVPPMKHYPSSQGGVGGIIQQAPSPVNVPPSSSTSSSSSLSKSATSPGAMNPPSSWPSQSPNSRMGHSPVASPHTPYRVSQSPVSINATSPHSPSFPHPSPKHSPSPTHIPLRSSPAHPHQQQNAPMQVSFKNPYLYASQPEPLRNTKTSSYNAPPAIQHEKTPYDRHYTEPPKAPASLLPSEYMQHQLPAKSGTGRPPDRHDPMSYPPSSMPKPNEMAKPASNLGKPNNHLKPHEKPNYREMINNVYAMRNATSEEDLNYKIIQRTLNKDISVHRSENDLSRSIFDTMPGPSPNKRVGPSAHLSRSSDSINAAGRMPDPNSASKYPYAQDYNSMRKYGPSASSSTGHIPTAAAYKHPPVVDNKLANLPICNDLTRNDISVTVSKVIRPPQPKPKPHETEVNPAQRSSFVENKDLSTVVISKMQTAPITEPRNAYASRTRPPEPPPPPQKPSTTATSTSVLAAPKRESPLDLSVKTVKTKADSTGCDDSAYASRNSITSTLKVDFAPNFSKHVRNMVQHELAPTQPAHPQNYAATPASGRYPVAGPSRPHAVAYEQQNSVQVPKGVGAAQPREAYAMQPHKGQDIPLPQNAVPYGQVHDQKVYQSTVHPTSAYGAERFNQHRSMPASASHAKYPEPHPNERPKVTEVESTRRMQMLPSTKEMSPHHYPPSAQPFERAIAQHPSQQVPFKDNRFVDSTSSRYREMAATNRMPESPVVHRGEDPIRSVYGSSSIAPQSRPQDVYTAAPSKPPENSIRKNSHYEHEPYAGKKRPFEPQPPAQNTVPASPYHPPEKKVAVDELYREHLAQAQHAQHHQHQIHQQQMMHHQQQLQQQQLRQAPKSVPQAYPPGQPTILHNYDRREPTVVGQNVSHPNYPPQQQNSGAYKHPSQTAYPQPSQHHSGDRLQHYPRPGPPDRSVHHPQQPTDIHRAGPAVTSNTVPSQAGLYPGHHLQSLSSSYPPSHTAAPPVDKNNSHLPYNGPQTTNLQSRQQPLHSSRENLAKPTAYSEQSITQRSGIPPGQPLPYNHGEVPPRVIAEPTQLHHSQNLTSRPAEYPSHYSSSSDYYASKRPIQDQRPVPTSNSLNQSVPMERRGTEYPSPNEAVSYMTSANRSRDHIPATQPQTWYPPVQAHVGVAAEKRELSKELPQQISASTVAPQMAHPNEPPTQPPRAGPNNIRNSVHPYAFQPPKESPTIHQSLPTPVVTAPPHRGADQNVIDKLRTSIEMREYEKQKLLNRQQINGVLPAEEEPQKSDIASILAARIRTKGELKGYTPIPPPETEKPPATVQVQKVEVQPCPVVAESTKPSSVELFSEEEQIKSAFDLMDWGSTCNDFVEQLQTGVKKRAKKRKAQFSIFPEAPVDGMLEDDGVKGDLPGTAYDGDIDRALVEQIKSESNAAAAPAKAQQESSSSDEDKPLHLLRQQSQSDVGRNASDKEPSARPKILPPSAVQLPPISSSSSTTKQPPPTSPTEHEKLYAKKARENYRLKQEKRLAARLSQTSSSDEEGKRNAQRSKKLIRKARSRTSGASTARNSSDSDNSSDDEDDAQKRPSFRERMETRKRKIASEKAQSNPDTPASKKMVTNIHVDENDRKIKLPIAITPSSVKLKREIITKAQIKWQPPSDKSGTSSDDDDAESPAKKADKTNEESPNKTRDPSDGEDQSGSQKSKTANRKSKLLEIPKVQETMTRSKRKKELEEKLANSKVLRNDKVIQNTPIKTKNKISEKSMITPPGRTTRSADQKSSEEKAKFQIVTRASKIDKSDDLKRKLADDDSDDKTKKKPNKIVKGKENSSSSSRESESDTEPKTVSERLLMRRSRLSNDPASTEKCTEPRKTRSSDRTKTESDSKKPPVAQKTPTPIKKPPPTTTPTKQKTEKSGQAETNTEKFPPGWELEVYQYKRALKIPQRLITIKGPAHHRVSTSLPDLDPPSSDASESFSADNSRNSSKRFAAAGNKTASDNTARSGNQKFAKKQIKPHPAEDESSNGVPESLQGKSIIDILHQRVALSRRLIQKKNKQHNRNNESMKVLPRSSQLQPLATPKPKNIYRGENHHIREIFGSDDRPASAPPELNDTKEETETRITFAQKYEEYLAAMNDVKFATRVPKVRKIEPRPEVRLEETRAAGVLDIEIKKEKLDDYVVNPEDDETQDTEINACMNNVANLKTEPMDANERDTPSIVSEHGDGVATPILFKRKKNNKIRSSRRKGSSGFDYIRKKKKPNPNNGTGADTVKKKRNSPVELLNTRDENDISKEIQRWVLNKGVGQSAMHKAARLGYIDVIAYCLERLGSNPDPKDNAGYTPLHEACSKGRLDIARLLLQYGANHSEVAASGIRPLHEASENGYVEIVRLLLSYGADPLVTTYSGQTPLMLAESNEMEQFIKNHLNDVQNTGPHKQPWKFPGPWCIYDPEISGFDICTYTPCTDDDCDDMDDNKAIIIMPGNQTCNDDLSPLVQETTKGKCDTNSNSIVATYDERNRNIFKNKLKTNCTVMLNSIESINHISTVRPLKEDYQSKNLASRRSTNEGHDDDGMEIGEEMNGDSELFEFEESEIPLPPLYLLKDEGAEKWIMLNDLCSLLKVKSKDTLLKQISPSLPPPTKELLRELKISDFLEKATCLQLLCAGEKLNIRSSKVVLVKYNENVRNLLGVKTIVMKF